MLTREQLRDAIGDEVISSDGEKIGTVTDIYVDVDAPDSGGWIGLHGGALNLRHRIVPLAEAELRDDCFYVPYTKDQILSAPDVASDDDDIEVVDEQQARGLWGHFGRDWDDYERSYGRASREVVGDDAATVDTGGEPFRPGETEIDRVRLRRWKEYDADSFGGNGGTAGGQGIH